MARRDARGLNPEGVGYLGIRDHLKRGGCQESTRFLPKKCHPDGQANKRVPGASVEPKKSELKDLTWAKGETGTIDGEKNLKSPRGKNGARGVVKTWPKQKRGSAVKELTGKGEGRRAASKGGFDKRENGGGREESRKNRRGQRKKNSGGGERRLKIKKGRGKKGTRRTFR